MNTLLLDPKTWDLMIDGSKNIAMASDPYSQAQDAASAIKTFAGECYYNTTLGTPYWETVFGLAPPLSLMKSYFVDAALTVPGTARAVCYIDSFVDRKVTGQVQIINDADQVAAVGF